MEPLWVVALAAAKNARNRMLPGQPLKSFSPNRPNTAVRLLACIVSEGADYMIPIEKFARRCAASLGFLRPLDKCLFLAFSLTKVLK